MDHGEQTTTSLSSNGRIDVCGLKQMVLVCNPARVLIAGLLSVCSHHKFMRALAKRKLSSVFPLD